MIKSISRSGWLCLVACSVVILAAGSPALGQSSDYDQPGDAPPSYDQPINDMSSTTNFEEQLAPHGRWIDTAEYGRVWIPNVDADFQPYATNGHWVVTRYGNTWASDYEWGWAAFHYGRWYRDDRFGWAWVPGRIWGPSWVSWRSGDGYYGWAPLAPRVSININIPLNSWTFVPQAYITSPQIYSYYLPRPRVVNVYRNTTVVNNFYRSNNHNYVAGPRRQEIEQVTRRRVDVRQIDRLNQPGRSVVTGQTVGIYAPRTTDQPSRRNGVGRNGQSQPRGFNSPSGQTRPAPEQRPANSPAGIVRQPATPPAAGENHRDKKQRESDRPERFDDGGQRRGGHRR